MIKNVSKFGQNLDNLLLCKQRIQETGKLYVRFDVVIIIFYLSIVIEYCGNILQHFIHCKEYNPFWILTFGF